MMAIKWTDIWWEGSVLSFLKAEWKVSDTGSAQCWASSFSRDGTENDKQKVLFI
jgi:hypothetical protein